MGHRIELGEIEMVVNKVEGVVNSCCIFDDNKKKIILYYTGDCSKAELVSFSREKLPRYMIPNLVVQLDTMPLTANGKINRLLLQEMYMNNKKS